MNFQILSFPKIPSRMHSKGLRHSKTKSNKISETPCRLSLLFRSSGILLLKPKLGLHYYSTKPSPHLDVFAKAETKSQVMVISVANPAVPAVPRCSAPRLSVSACRGNMQAAAKILIIFKQNCTRRRRGVSRLLAASATIVK